MGTEVVAKLSQEFGYRNAMQVPRLEKIVVNVGVGQATQNPKLLEKATEIGIGQITPLLTKRGEKIHLKTERFRKILVSAMLQSQQTYLPVLHEPQSLEEVLIGKEEQRFVAWCSEDGERQALSTVMKPGKKTLILIGPEGDFTPEEVHLCLQHGALPVTLGPNRLRTETAGLYATVVYNAL